MAEQQQRRPYLDPKPGENLPEKNVSQKAHGRLSVAADAIAATKKAIQHQGNQVPALKATNMNSQYRLMVMRDRRCWEYTTPEAQQLAYANREADIAAKADLAHGGNCGEHAWVAYHYLRLNAAGQRIQVSQKSGLDHAFVVIGDVAKEPDNELVVSDPWPNNPTACLWEDHFAFCDRKDLIDHQSQVADGKSYKAAIMAGLKLSAYGEQMVKKSESEAETKKKTDDWQANHFWWHDDAASNKFHYKQEEVRQGVQRAESDRTEAPARTE